MEKFICTTCGTQYPPSAEPPVQCLICNEERQYVNPDGQSWTTSEKMKQGQDYHNEIIREEEGLYSITTKPKFGIGQTAYLVQNNGFNVLWDCLTYLDGSTISGIERLGGLQAIALSHPHYYSAQVEWAETFDVPIYIHEDDKEWVVQPNGHIRFWQGESLTLSGGLTLHRLGGHFKGAAVLHWEERGVLLTGDTIQVVADQNWVSFMYSYPNLIPLPAETVDRISKKTGELTFDRLYNAFHRKVNENAREAVKKSAERYIAALEGRLFST